MVQNMDMESSPGQMIQATLDNSSITISVVKENTNGVISAATRASGRTIRCMAKEFSRGLMEDATSVTI